MSKSWSPLRTDDERLQQGADGEGEIAVTDGPFLEAKEFLAGYYLLDCATPERANELAAIIPDASVEGLGVEVRAVIHELGL